MMCSKWINMARPRNESDFLYEVCDITHPFTNLDHCHTLYDAMYKFTLSMHLSEYISPIP